MQKNTLKKVILFFIVFSLVAQLSNAQTFDKQIKVADSLFNRKEYVQSLKIYERIFAQSKQASPGMLLKMAYVREGLEDYTRALYYLSLYYLYKPQPAVITKMKELSNRYNLTGYEFKDEDFFIVLYDRYYIYLAFTLIIICILVFLSMFLKKLRGEYIPIRHGFGFTLFLVSVFLLLNLQQNQSKAIVARDNVYVMSAPSAGAKVVRIMKKGHRLDVKGKQDVWLEVTWNDKPAYIRQQNVWLVQ